MIRRKRNLFKTNHFCISIIFVLVIVGIGLIVHQNSKSEIIINDKHIRVDVADTLKKRQKGLSGQKTLCKDCGMLFIFDTAAIYEFWMPNMFFDIDIIWIKNDIVVDISEYVSHKMPMTIIKSQYPVDKVVELPAGRSQELGIVIGHGIQCVQ